MKWAAASPLRLVGTTWLRCEQVARHGIGTGARTSANVAHGTSRTLTFQLRTVTQRHKQCRIAEQLRKRMLHDVTGGQRQITAGPDFSFVIDKHEALPVTRSFGGAGDYFVCRQFPTRFTSPLLQQIALVMLSLSGFDLKMDALRSMI